MSYPEKRYLELAEKWMLGTITDKEKAGTIRLVQ